MPVTCPWLPHGAGIEKSSRPQWTGWSGQSQCTLCCHHQVTLMPLQPTTHLSQATGVLCQPHKAFQPLHQGHLCPQLPFTPPTMGFHWDLLHSGHVSP